MARVQVLLRKSTSLMKRSKRLRRAKVSVDGVGAVSGAGVGMLRKMARDTGLMAGVTAALADTYIAASPGLVPYLRRLDLEHTFRFIGLKRHSSSRNYKGATQDVKTGSRAPLV